MKQLSLHEQRGITFAELGALYGFIGMAETGLLKHGLEAIGPDHVFNMSIQCRSNDECGSVACIGGTVAMIMGKDTKGARDYVGGGWIGEGKHSKSLRTLYFPDMNIQAYESYDSVWKTITLKQAVQATKNFIDIGYPLWDKILGRGEHGVFAIKLRKLRKNRGFDNGINLD